MNDNEIKRVSVVEQFRADKSIDFEKLNLKEKLGMEVSYPNFSGLMIKEFFPLFKYSDAFVILPSSNPLVVASILVDRQYSDVAALKPVIIYQPEGTVSPWVSLINHFKKIGFLKQDVKRLINYVVSNEDELVKALEEGLENYDELRHGENGATKVSNGFVDFEEAVPFVKEHNKKTPWLNKAKPDVNITVFCSCSTKEEKYIEMARKTGSLIAKCGAGTAFGAGNVSMMGKVAEAAQGEGGFVKGITTTMFIGKELMPEGAQVCIDEIIIVPDIYHRMFGMFKSADALVVIAGSIGTVQETIACMEMRKNNPELKNRKVILVNENGFWDQFIDVLLDAGYILNEDFYIIDSVEEIESSVIERIRQEKSIKISAE